MYVEIHIQGAERLRDRRDIWDMSMGQTGHTAGAVRRQNSLCLLFFFFPRLCSAALCLSLSVACAWHDVPPSKGENKSQTSFKISIVPVSRGKNHMSQGLENRCSLSSIRSRTLVAPYRAIPRDYLSDIPLLRAMGFWCLNMANWVRYPLPIFWAFPLGEHAKWKCNTPLQKGYLSDTCTLPYENKGNGCIAILSRKGIARYGGVSRTGPLSQRLRSAPAPNYMDKKESTRHININNFVRRLLGWGGVRPGVKRYVLCAEPKEHEHFRPGARPGGSVTRVTEQLFMC